MKKITRRAYAGLMAAMVFLGSAPAQTALVKAESTGTIRLETVTSEKRTVRSAKKIKYRLVETKSGRIKIRSLKKKKYLRSKFVTVGKCTYYVNKDGYALKGWQSLRGRYYFFDRRTARMVSGERVDGILLPEDGAKELEKDSWGYKKVHVLMRARKQMEALTNPKDSRAEKLKKCYYWIEAKPYKRYRKIRPYLHTKGYEMTFADDIFLRGQGCCVSDSAALAFMAVECGYHDVYLANDTGHGWAQIEGLVYDPLFAEAKSFSLNYGVPYGTYKLHPYGDTGLRKI